MIIDTHCHLDLVADRRALIEVLADAKLSGVTTIIVPGINEENWSRVATLAAEHSDIYYTLGFHPLFLEQVNVDSIANLEQAVAESLKGKCVAIGECGLDFFMDRSSETLQKQLLIEQIRIANHYQLPIVLHCRKAHQDLVSLLKKHPADFGGVVHGFSGSLQQAEDFIKLGLKIGVGGVITYDRAKKTRATIASLPLESLLIETDAPDMPLSGYQGLPNEPKMANLVLSSLIMLRTENEQTVASQLLENSKLTFNICD